MQAVIGWVDGCIIVSMPFYAACAVRACELHDISQAVSALNCTQLKMHVTGALSLACLCVLTLCAFVHVILQYFCI